MFDYILVGPDVNFTQGDINEKYDVRHYGNVFCI